MRRILVATDGSQRAAEAADVAIELALETGAALTAVSVNIPGPELVRDTTLPISDAGESETEQRVRAVIEAAHAAGLADATGVVAHGQPIAEIVRVAREIDAELVVVGAHGEGPFRGWLLGSVARELISACPVPVTVVGLAPAGAVSPPVGVPWQLRTVMIATDGSDSAADALEAACALCTETGARLVTVSVDDALIDDPAKLAAAEVAATAARERGLEVTALARHGKAWEQVLAAAREVDADMIVVGHRSGHGLGKPFSVARGLVTHADRPITVVPD